ncbi:cytochrome P450 phenylacetate 2-hydroxylase [Aspergillus pseudoustus]|uniref:Cytochrome P450 phenylacetate 2-hydroxylase n=1 Tax=Aspergillus pseudoustus TaxID=1810923 RepID=A0ABR4JPA7_9EURO
MNFYLAVFLSTAGLVALVIYANQTDIPRIKGIPEIPAVPFFGNLLHLGQEHALNTLKLSKKYGPVFQARLGNKRVIVSTTFDSVKYFWITHQSSLISRPTLHTFHKVVSASQGLTIGTSPWDESCKRRRKAAATALNRPAVQTYMPIIDLESCAAIKDIFQSISTQPLSKEADIDPTPFFQRFALNTSLALSYGIRIDDRIDNELLREVITVERAISTLRSTSNNWQDYIPLLRLFSSRNDTARDVRQRRDRYLSRFLSMLKERIDQGIDKPCITGSVLKDPEAKLSEAEVKSICVTMIAGGLDTVPGNIVLGIAYLSSPHGQDIQRKAYNLIQQHYPDGDAWEKCVLEEKIDYISAFVKETLRFWTVLPMCLPRVSIRDIPYEQSTIPAGTTFLMNAWAANYDNSHFDQPTSFIPERFMKSEQGTGIQHYSYGAGSRMCPGFHLANRELYAVFTRLICSFEIMATDDPADLPVLDALECNSVKTSLTTEPKKFKVRFRARDSTLLERCIRKSEKRTENV